MAKERKPQGDVVVSKSGQKTVIGKNGKEVKEVKKNGSDRSKD